VRLGVRMAATVGLVALAPVAVAVGLVGADLGGGELGLVVVFAIGVTFGVAMFVERRVRTAITDPLIWLRDAVMAESEEPLASSDEPGHLLASELPEVRELLAATGSLVARTRQLRSDVEQARRRFNTALERVGSVLGATHDRSAIVEVLVETVALISRAPCTVFWVPDRGRLTARVVEGTGVVLGARLDRAGSVAATAAAAGSTIEAPSGAGEPAGSHAIVTPVQSGTRRLGVLAVYADGPLEPDDRTTALALIRQAETALLNTFLHEEAQSLAITDGLTGLWNRRQLELSAGIEVERASRFGEPFAVLVADLDRFKIVNDTYGHQVGDAALVELSHRFKAATRDVDIVARYGGEEFVLLLPRTDVEGGMALAEKVRHAVGDRPFKVDDMSLPLTISIGVAVYPRHGSSFREVLGIADAALYQAKRTRDAVGVAPSDPANPTEDDNGAAA